MLLSILLTVHPADDTWRLPNAVRAYAYALLAAGDPEHAEALHAAAADLRFTAAALPNEARPALRVTALDARTARAVLAGCAAIEQSRELRADGHRLRVVDCTLNAPPVAELSDYAALIGTPHRREVALRFATPTTFSQGGDRHLALPVPELMARSWARRWNRFAPEDLRFGDECLERVAAGLELRRASVETEYVSLGKGAVVGFTGEALLRAGKGWGEEERRAFAALAAYSRFSGTGARAAQGFGLTVAGDGRGA